MKGVIKDLENIIILLALWLMPPLLAIGFGVLIVPELITNSFTTACFTTSFFNLIVIFFFTVIKDFFERDKKEKEEKENE